jgi:hypothetical protein
MYDINGWYFRRLSSFSRLGSGVWWCIVKDSMISVARLFAGWIDSNDDEGVLGILGHV